MHLIYSRWSTLKRLRILVMVVIVVTTMAMLVNHQKKTTNVLEKDIVERELEPFIPDFPNQTVIGKPGSIPQHFLIEEADACLRKGKDVEVVAYVHSAISRVTQRQETRLTWANTTALKMVVVFMVGRAKNDQEREILWQESQRYHDIVQGDYGDHYKLLSYKGLSSLYWITRNCAYVPWTLHADDDILIDTFILKQLIQDFNNSPNREMLHCRLLNKERVHRRGRWKVSRRELSARRYPPFCQGTMWLLPTKEIWKLLDAVNKVKFLWVDDAYITGLLARYAKKKISPIPVDRFGIGSYSEADVGKKVVWFHTHENITSLWSDLLEYYNITVAS